MAQEIDEGTFRFISEHRVARLATVGVDSRPSVIPICFIFDGVRIYSPIDEKPKSVPSNQLKRVRNIQANPSVALVIDDYSEDWLELSYVLIAGSAKIISADVDRVEHMRAVEQLREKYAQYRQMKIDERPIIRITVTRIKRWAPDSREIKDGKED